MAALRAELDRIDDALHDGLMRRAELVAQVAAVGGKGGVPLRPGREATIIRRLLARNRGALDPSTVVRVWREVLAGSSAQQHPLRVSLGSPAMLDLAREHFGAVTPMAIEAGPDAALRCVRDGAATAAVLPWPGDGHDWWTALLDDAAPPAHLVARLPVWTRWRSAESACMLTAAAPDPSGDDRSLIACEVPEDADPASFARDLAAAGFVVDEVALVSRDARRFGLADVAGFVRRDDGRCEDGRLPGRAVVLGAYAVPIGDTP